VEELKILIIKTKKILSILICLVLLLLVQSLFIPSSSQGQSIINQFSSIDKVPYGISQTYQMTKEIAKNNPALLSYILTKLERELNSLIKKEFVIETDPKKFFTDFPMKSYMAAIRFLNFHAHVLGGKGKHEDALIFLRCSFKLSLTVAGGVQGNCPDIITQMVTIKNFNESFYSLMAYILNYDPPVKFLISTMQDLEICRRKIPEYVFYLDQEHQKCKKAMQFIATQREHQNKLQGWKKYFTEAYMEDVQRLVDKRTDPLYDALRTVWCKDNLNADVRKEKWTDFMAFEDWVSNGRPTWWQSIWNPKESLAYMVATMMVPNMLRSHYQNSLTHCRLRGMIIALGAKIYYLTKGNWPGKLSDLPLVKQISYSKDVLSGDEQNFVLKTVQGKPKIYSLGFNGKDENSEFTSDTDKSDIPILTVGWLEEYYPLNP
jgi:hypothetical protein